MRVKLELSRRSVARAIGRVEEARRSFDDRLDELCRRLVEEGGAAAALRVPVDTGELRDGIRVERKGDVSYLLVSEGEYAAYVEFGTGVVGQGTYGGNLPESWGYDERRTPSAHDPSDPTRWYYMDRDGNVRSTRGHEAEGYMLAASEEMRAQVRRMAREVWK